MHEAIPEKDAQSIPADSSRAWHEVLNLSPNATAEEIRDMYEALMREYHPDKVAGLGHELRELAEGKSKEIAVAYREAMHSRESAT